MNITSKSIVVDHIRVASDKPFTAARRALEAFLRRLDPYILEMLGRGDQAEGRCQSKCTLNLLREEGCAVSLASVAGSF